MSRVYWDSMLFAYWLEGSTEYAGKVGNIHTRMVARGDRLCASSFTLAELMVEPVRAGNAVAAKAIRDFILGPDIELIDFKASTAERYAEIRASTNAKPADAIHLACAATAGIDLFLTNDRKLQGLVVPGIQFIAGLDVNVL